MGASAAQPPPGLPSGPPPASVSGAPEVELDGAPDVEDPAPSAVVALDVVPPWPSPPAEVTVDVDDADRALDPAEPSSPEQAATATAKPLARAIGSRRRARMASSIGAGRRQPARRRGVPGPVACSPVRSFS
jgi:hypothetical protein